MNEQTIEIRALDASRFGVEAEAETAPVENQDEQALLDALELGVEPVGLGV